MAVSYAPLPIVELFAHTSVYDENFLTYAKALIMGGMYTATILSILKCYDEGDITVVAALSIRTLQIPLVFLASIFIFHQSMAAIPCVGCFLTTIGCISLTLYSSPDTEYEVGVDEKEPLLFGYTTDSSAWTASVMSHRRFRIK